MWAPGIWPVGMQRTKSGNALAVPGDVMVIDLDGTDQTQVDNIRQAISPFAACGATSFSHLLWTKGGKCCWRFVVLLDRRPTLEEWPRLWHAFDEAIVKGSGGIGNDPGMLEPSRCIFIGAKPAHTPFESWISQSDVPFPIDRLLAFVDQNPPLQTAISAAMMARAASPSISHRDDEDPRTEPAPEWVVRRAQQLMKAMPAADQVGGKRLGFAAAGALVRGLLLTNEQAFHVFDEHFNPRCLKAWDEDRLVRELDNAAGNSGMRWGALRDRDWSRPSPNEGEAAKAYRAVILTNTAESVLASARAGTYLEDSAAWLARHIVEWCQAGHYRDWMALQVPIKGLVSKETREAVRHDVERAYVEVKEQQKERKKADRVAALVVSEGDRTVEWAPDRSLAALLTDHMKLSVHDRGRFWRYSPETGVYAPVPDMELQRAGWDLTGVIDVETGKRVRMTDAKVRSVLKAATAKVGYHDFFDEVSDKAGIAFSNGFVSVDIDGVKLLPHSPDHRAWFGVDAEFPSSPNPVQFLSLLDRVWSGDEDQQQKVNVLQEWLGVALLGRATEFQKALACLGDGSDGKSSLLDVLVDLFPPDMCSAHAPHDWGREHVRADLAGRLLNVVPEVDAGVMREGATFKALITGDRVGGCFKYQAAFSFRPRAAHAFGMNATFATRDSSAAFFRRFVVLTFNKRFQRGRVDNTLVSQERQARTERATLTIGEIRDRCREERADVIAWALAGAVRLMRQRSYTEPSSHDRVISEWREANDPFAEWLTHETEPSTDPATNAASDELWRAFEAHQEKAQWRLTRPVFYQRLKKALGQPIEINRRMTYGVKLKRFRGPR